MVFKKYNAYDWVNTSDAYSAEMFVGEKGVVIPYINVGLMPGNPINGVQSVIDYSYYVILGVENLSLKFSSLNDHESLATIIEYIAVGGYAGHDGFEARIECKEIFLYVPATSTFRTKIMDHFIPLPNTYFAQNIKTQDADSFFLLENLPKEITNELGGDISVYYPN